MKLSRRQIPAALAATVLTVGLAGCGAGEVTQQSSATPSSGTATSGDADAQAAGLQIDDTWVKSADSGMSAAFGILRNTSDRDITVTSVTSDASPVMELHETVENSSGEMIMQERDGGFVIPAGGEMVLQPGGNHLMLMDITTPVKAGDEVTFRLSTSAGDLTFAAPAKDYSGANERYVPSE